MYKTINLKLEGYEYPVYKNMSVVKSNADKIVKGLKKLYPRKGIVLFARGSSGIVIATAITLLLPCNIVYLRKPEEQSHSSCGLYRDLLSDNCVGVVVDDFISLGGTMAAISETLSGFSLHEKIEAVCIQNGEAGLNHELNFPNLKYLLTK